MKVSGKIQGKLELTYEITLGKKAQLRNFDEIQADAQVAIKEHLSKSIDAEGAMTVRILTVEVS